MGRRHLRRANSGECAVELRANLGVALARRRLETSAIEDRDVTAVVTDVAGVLQLAGDVGDGGAAHGEHLRKELVGQEEVVTADAVVGHQQPARAALLSRMSTVARHLLERLREQCAYVAIHSLVEARERRRQLTESTGSHHESATWDLRDATSTLHPSWAQHDVDTDHALVADGCGLDQGAVVEDRHEGCHHRCWEPHLPEWTSFLCQHRPTLELTDLTPTRDVAADARRERVEQAIAGSLRSRHDVRFRCRRECRSRRAIARRHGA